MWSLRRHTPVAEISSPIDPAAEQELRLADAVMGFRHRLDTDTDFRQSFGDAMKEALARSAAKSADEVDANAEAFSGNNVLGQDLTERAKAAKGDLFENVIALLSWAATSEEFQVKDLLTSLRNDIGMAVNEGFSEGLLQLPPDLTDERSMGMVHSQLGFIVAVERYSPDTSMANLQEQSRQAREAIARNEQGGQ